MAEMSAAAGDDVGTLAAVERFHRLPADRIWRAWAYPRSLYLEAAAHLRLGEREAAQGASSTGCLKLLARADPGRPAGEAGPGPARASCSSAARQRTRGAEGAPSTTETSMPGSPRP